MFRNTTFLTDLGETYNIPKECGKFSSSNLILVLSLLLFAVAMLS